MKKSIIALAMVVTSAFAVSAQAADGTVNFQGNITSAACDITPENQSLTVPMGSWKTTDFASAGAESSQKGKIDIKLTKCDITTLKTATVTFSGAADSTNPDTLALDQVTGAATGVAIKLYNADDSALKLNSESSASTLVEGDNTLHFLANYISTVDAVTAGSANATAEFTLAYL